MKYIVIIVATLLILGGGLYYFLTPTTEVTNPPKVTDETLVDTLATSTVASTTDGLPVVRGPESTIGTSAGGTDITAYHFGNGPDEILFIGVFMVAILGIPV